MLAGIKVCFRGCYRALVSVCVRGCDQRRTRHEFQGTVGAKVQHSVSVENLVYVGRCNG